MTTYLYLHAPWRFLVERRIAESTDDETFVLVCASAARTVGLELKRRYPSVSACLYDEEMLHSEAPPTTHLIVLPMSFEMRPMPYKPGVETPFLSPHYPLFNRLWRIGFREVELYSLAGTRRLAMPLLLDAFHNRHVGRRCFIVGNGPSLNRTAMPLLCDEITLGSNQCYLGYPDWGFQFTYWGIYDQYQIEAYDEDYEKHLAGHAAHFMPFEYAPLLRLPDACLVNQVWCREAAHQFSDAPDRVYRGYTVTYMLMQIAAIMGCNPIILIGADHNYPLNRRYFPSRGARLLRRHVTRKLRETMLYRATNAARLEWMRTRAQRGQPANTPLWNSEHAIAPTHFTDKYTLSGRRNFYPPEPEAAEADFRCARRWAEQHNVNILNATPETKLDVFDKVDFKALF